MNYPFNLVKDSTGFLVTFPDIPEAITAGETEEEAMEMAEGALLCALEIYFDDKRVVPLPARESGSYVVELAPSVYVKILLHNEIRTQKLSQKELAVRLNMKQQQVSRMLGAGYFAPSIDVLALCCKALGRELKIQIV